MCEDPRALPTSELLPARTFRSSVGHRHAPQQPYLETVGDLIKVESKTEAVCAHLVSRRGDVQRLWPQPFWMERDLNGKGSWACPDFLLQHSSGALTVLEVKASRNLSAKTLRGLEAVRASCQKLGFRFELMTALSRHDAAIFDILFAYSSSRVPSGPGWEVLRSDILEATRQPKSLAQLWELGPKSQIKALIWWMAWHNDICFDWSQGLTLSTLFTRHDVCTLAGSRTGSRARCGPEPSPRLADLWKAVK